MKTTNQLLAEARLHIVEYLQETLDPPFDIMLSEIPKESIPYDSEVKYRVSELPGMTARLKYMTRCKTQNAIHQGLIIKPEECEVCHRKTPVIECHHVDYNDAFNIKWLCPTCHKEEHQTRFIYLTESKV